MGPPAMGFVRLRRSAVATPVRVLLAFIAVVGCGVSAALGQVAPQVPLQAPLPQMGPVPGAQGPLFPDTTLQPNVQPAPTAPILGHPLFNPYLRPIPTEPL